MLFPALLQGDRAVETIVNQLNRIRRVKNHFDAVAIIRGGGGDVGLTCYNNYELSKAIALFPIPVITGIGHSTNETVSEIEGGLISVDELYTKVKRAALLIKICKNKLTATEEDVNDILKELESTEGLKSFHQFVVIYHVFDTI